MWYYIDMKLFYTNSPTDSRTFLNKILREKFGLLNPRFLYNEHGKPLLDGVPLFFNVTHSGSITAAVFGERECGIDAEERKPRKTETIEKRLTAAERQEDFFRLWTAKEAYVKYKGASLAAMLPLLEYRGGILYENGSPVQAHLYFTERENCTLCVCTAAPEPIDAIQL